MNTCRFCDEVSFRPHEDMYRYGRRHYAVKWLGLIAQVKQRFAELP